METAGNIPKMKHLGLPDDQEMAINVSLPVRRASTAVLNIPDGSVNGEPLIRLTTNTFVSAVCTFSTRGLTYNLAVAARTKYDIIIDESSNKPGEQSFEKMIAGLYLGEVFRLVLVEMIDAGELFLGQNTYKLEKAYAMDTAFLSLMERFVVRLIGPLRWDLRTLPAVTRRTSCSVSSVSSRTSSVLRLPLKSANSSDRWPS